MCNPRKIVMHATEQLARAWQAELERTARVGGTTTGEARLSQPLAEMLAPPALRAFERAVGADAAWIQRDDAYYLVIPGGHAAFRPQTGELEMVVQLSEELVGTGTGRAVVSGTVTGEGAGSAQGSYYDDAWRGYSKERAEREADAAARQQARQEAEQRAAFLAEQARSEALGGLSPLGAQAETEALLAAQQDLERQRAERGAALRTQAESGLAGLREDTMRGVMRTVAAGLQQAVIEYAQQHGAIGLVVEEGEDVVEIQFELEA